MYSAVWIISSLVAATNVQVALPTRNWSERYTYETIRADDASSTSVERVTMQFLATNGTLFTHYSSEHAGGADEINIRCGLDGGNVVASKQEYTTGKKRLSDARIWIDDGKVHVEQLLDDNRKKLRSRDTGGKPVAADASLMVLFRFFPFDKGQTQDVMIATFTQHFVTMEVRQLGTETIMVPAGKIDCYKLEGIVDLFVTSIRTVYWLNKQEPHFLVRYEGKRGLFLAPTYVTSLISAGDPARTNTAASATDSTTDNPARAGH